MNYLFKFTFLTLKFSLLSSISGPLSANELDLEKAFRKPTENDYYSVAFSSLNRSHELVDNLNESKSVIKPCDEQEALKQSLESVFWATEKKDAEIIKSDEAECYCDIASLDNEKKKLVLSFLGEIYEQSITLDSGNDNLFHGTLLTTPYRNYDGDDRGRTFSTGLRYDLIGSEGRFAIDVGSVGFGELVKVDGKRRDADNRHYLNFREYNHVNLELVKNFDLSDKDASYFFTSEFGFYNQTDYGFLARDTQDRYHRMAKDTFGLNVIQYNYQVVNPDVNTLSAKAGLGREIYMDISNWKCRIKSELLVGASQEIGGKGEANFEAKVKNEAEFSHKSLPWVALSTWIEATVGHLGKGHSYNATLKGSKRVGPVRFEPFIGVEKHFTEMDTKYSEQGGAANEIYHKLGVTIKF